MVAIDRAGATLVVYEGLDARDDIEALIRPSGGAFSAPRVISGPDPGPDESVDGQQLVLGPRGDAVVLWSELFSGRSWAAIRRPGSGFSGPQQVGAGGYTVAAFGGSGDGVLGYSAVDGMRIRSVGRRGRAYGQSTRLMRSRWADDIAVRVGLRGAATAVWRAPRSAVAFVARRRRRGVRWIVRRLSPPGVRAYAVRLAMNERGQAIVAWRAGRTGAQRQFAVAGSSVKGFGRVRTLTRSRTDTGAPAVAIDDRGGGVVAFSTGLKPTRNVYAARLRAGKAPEPPQRLSGPRNVRGDPRVVINGTGASAVTWRDASLNGGAWLVSTAAAKQSFVAAQPLEFSTDESYTATVAVDRRGWVLAAWGGRRGNMAAAWPAGLPVSGITALGRDECKGAPNLATEPGGFALATWLDACGSGARASALAAARRPGETFGATQPLDAPAELAATQVQAAIGAGGRGFAVWEPIGPTAGSLIGADVDAR